MNLKFCTVFCILLLSSFKATECSKILSVFAFPAPAHYAFIEPLLKELAKRGHQITSITNFPQTQKIDNFRDLVIEENLHLFDDIQFDGNYPLDAEYYNWVFKIYAKSAKMCKNVLANLKFKQLISKEHFDLIILEVFMSETFFGLSEYLNAPVIAVSAWGTFLSIDQLVGNISPMSYIPNLLMSTMNSDIMNFWQRSLNVLLEISDWSHYTMEYLPMHKNIYDQYFTNATLSFYEAQKHISLVLLNDHFSLTHPRPYVTNMIEVAGLNLKEEPEQITPALQELLDTCTNGIIYMTIDLKYLPIETLKVFLRQFALLNETILWQSSAPKINLSLSSNIHISEDLPQSPILAHTNTKLFISQGGCYNVMESIYYAKPILGILCYVSEDDYVDYVARINSGISIKRSNINDKSLATVLRELLYNKYYQEIASVLSFRFRDQPMKPMDRAIYWVEYVLRHQGAAHLRNKGQNLTLWQYYNIDVYIVMLAAFGILIYLANFLVIFCCSLKMRAVMYHSKYIDKKRK